MPKIEIKCAFCGQTFEVTKEELNKNVVIYRDGEETAARNVTCKNCDRVNTIDVPKAWLG